MAYQSVKFLVAVRPGQDQQKLQVLISRLFHGADITLVDSGVDAWERISDLRPSIVICDAELPEYSGFEICDRIKKSEDLHKTYVVLMIDASASALKVQALEAGADDFLSMPIEPDDLLAKLQAATRIVRLHHLMENERRKLRIVSEQLNKDLEELLACAVNMIHCRIPQMKEQMEQIARASVWMAKAFEDLSETKIEYTRIAANLCNVGKLYLPDELVHTPVTLEGKATHELMRQVPLYSEQLLKPSSRLEKVIHIIRHVFENYDGSGFPDRLRVREIPIEARIIRPVLDFSNYCDFLKMPPLSALEKVKRDAKHVYDPRFTMLLDEYLWSNSPETLVRNVRAVQIYDLDDGMKVARDIVTNSGLKLIPAGAILSQRTIHRLIQHASTDPIIGAIYIMK